MDSRVVFLSLGGLGVGGAGISGLLIFKPWEARVSTFQERYRHALLYTGKDNESWNNKYTSLKEARPKHLTLIEAYEESKKGTSNDTEAKRLMRLGCQAIYESKIDNKDHFSDFQKYCSFNNKDKIGAGKELVSQKTDFDSLWTSFNEKKESDFQKGFGKIHKIRGQAISDTWKDTMLKECERLSTEIFEGEIPNFKEFCTKVKAGAGAGAG